jgi:hypothetical protein
MGNPSDPAVASVGGRSDSRIDAGGRAELSASELELLARQARNREAEGLTPGEVEARNLRSITVNQPIKSPNVYHSNGVYLTGKN